MKKIITSICTLCFMNIASYAQQDINVKFEVGAMGSGFVYHGDLTETRLGHLKDLKYGAGIYLKYHATPVFAIRTNLYRGSLAGNDADFTAEWRKQRAYKFSTSLTEVSVMLEADILGKGRFKSFKETGRHYNRWGLYLFAGSGAAFTNASRSWNGLNRAYFYKDAPEKIGQDSVNVPNRISWVFPAGVGVRFDVSKHFSLFAEAGYRFTITDNLDGYKYSVYSSKYDGYTAYSFGISYRFDRDTRYRRQMLVQ
ncbi:MAG TPA: DUF6089 family protein [Flavipsychrobacter sp.]|mgnify:CR=1 FL=1|nr:DUF6089 family protein [Flavipsychrobacter sp.]